MYNKEYWDDLFMNRKSVIPYEAFLMDFEYLIKDKTILDIGSGDGRNSVYFSRLSSELTCIDYSIQGLNKIQEKAKANNLNIETYCYDIELEEINIRKTFDVICFIHIYVNSKVLEKFSKMLNKNGKILVMTFLKESV